MTEFSDYLREIFREFGAVEIKRMFGGQGVFYEGLMIGLIARDTLYLKADKQSAQLFSERGLEPFSYPKGDTRVAMSYYEAPGEALEDPDEMKEWAEAAYAAALRSR
jgi:DNA transformation protein